jgi:hypothetical protein
MKERRMRGKKIINDAKPEARLAQTPLNHT